jgi:hypothetical protein
VAANTAPIFPLTADNQWPATALTAANTARDGTGTVTLVYTAPTDGGSVVKIVLVSRGANPRSVARVFLNNGLTNATPANNTLLTEQVLPMTTASEIEQQHRIEIPMNMWLVATHRLYMTLGTAVTDGWQATAVAQKFS